MRRAHSGNGAGNASARLGSFLRARSRRIDRGRRTSARVTHAHPLGVEGAVLIALATQALLEGRSAAQVLDTVRTECTTPELSERISDGHVVDRIGGDAQPARCGRATRQWDDRSDIVPDGPLHRASASEEFVRDNDEFYHRMPRRRGHDRRDGGCSLGHRERRRAVANEYGWKIGTCLWMSQRGCVGDICNRHA